MKNIIEEIMDLIMESLPAMFIIGVATGVVFGGFMEMFLGALTKWMLGS